MCSAVTDENYAASDILNVNIKSKNGKLQKKSTNVLKYTITATVAENETRN